MVVRAGGPGERADEARTPTERAAPTSRWSANRGRRVAMLLPALALMGVADLAYTLEHMTSIGMYEMNPLARLIVAEGGADNLALFKLCTLGVCCGILFRLRHARQAEIGAWVCAAVMLALMLHWDRYAEYTPQIAASAHAAASPEFVRLSR